MTKAGSTEKVVLEIRRHTRRRFSAKNASCYPGLLSLLLFECIPVQLSQGRGYLRDLPRRQVHLNDHTLLSRS